ncbi:hypothetical protein [Sphingobium sp. CFD-1]|uniref:hypothetical protein n=1 Tax=Sphingobium sp. CFD-1 TaxID=2878545 RepID=UPI00214B90D2|nr:hypothetical protein [Sphingobium sp. CFD-1]
MTEILPAERGLEAMIARFKQALPGWWYSLGECEKSCDASCGPTRDSDDLALIPHDERFNSGFHCDLPQPSTLAEALDVVREEALSARFIAQRRASIANGARRVSPKKRFKL